MEQISVLLRQGVGFEVESVGPSAFEIATRRRMQACGLDDLRRYLARLQASAEEYRLLVEELVVPETWFFRDEAPFAFLGDWVRTVWRSRPRPRPLRVLAAGCSTGEEAHSIAIVLLDTGLAPQGFAVQGVDISERALAIARQGQYRARALRGDPARRYAGYFTEDSQGRFSVTETVRQSVKFDSANLADPTFLTGTTPFDVIFCRNVLIYFDRPARETVVRTLERLLADEGLLFVGHAEALQLLAPHFHPMGPPAAFAYGKNVAALPRPAVPAAPARREAPRQRRTAPRHQPTPSQEDAQVQTAVTAPLVADPLQEARRLADRGLLAEAAELCRQHQESAGPSPEALFLLGTIAHAEGKLEEAERFFEKAVYLDAGHAEALHHLSLLADGRGDTAGARLLRRRVQRAGKAQGKS